MSLADSIFSITRKLTYQVIVNGVWLLNPVDGKATVLGFRTKRSFDSPVPTCTITVNRIPDWVQRGQTVEVNLGFDGVMVRVFTGTVQDRAPGVESGHLNCVGNLYAVYRTVELPDRDVTGLTTKAAIEAILDYVGITSNREVPAAGFTLGTASTAILRRATSSHMIQTIMETELWKIYENGDGKVIIVGELTGPGVSAWRTYSTDTQATARILGGRAQEDPGYTRDRVTVTGATVVEGTPPDDTSRTIGVDPPISATLIGDTPIRPALPSGSHIDTGISNHLIDTDARAATIAGKLLTHYARVPRQVPLELPGDPQLELGQTIGVEFPELLLTGRWLVNGLEHIVDDNGFVTRVDLRGGDEFGGIVRFDPEASFNYQVEREVFGTKVWVFVTFDASGSQGITAGIASYAWADDETTTPDIATLTDAIITVRIDPTTISEPWTVTLTVTDDDGLTGTVSQEIDVDVGAASVQIPAVFAAIDNNMSATPDGGQTWNDDGDTDVLSVAAAPPDGVSAGRAVYGLDDGSIMLTTDFLATNAVEVKAAGGGGIRALAFDWRNPLIVWAVDDEANVYLSIDKGATWNLYGALRTILSLGSATLRHIGLPAAGGIWVYGGTGANNPLIAYAPDASNPSWTQLAFGGDLLADLGGPAGDSAGLVGLQEEGNFGTLSGSNWTMQNTGSQTERVNLKNLGGTLWRVHSGTTIMDIGDLERSIDGGVNWTVSFAKFASDWGPVDVVRTPSGNLFTVIVALDVTEGAGQEYRVYRSLDNGDNWDLVHTLPAVSAVYPRGGPLMSDPFDGNGRVFASYYYAGGNRGFVYTEDDGDTWTTLVPTVPPPMTVDQNAMAHALVAIGKNGRLFHCEAWLTDELYYSDDDGDNWATVTTDLSVLFTTQRQLIHAEDEILYMAGRLTVGGLPTGRIYKSTDNGLNWTIYMQGENLNIPDTDGVSDIWGIAYDVGTRTLYAHTTDIDADSGDAGRGDPIAKIVEGGSWANSTEDAESAFANPGFVVNERCVCAPARVGGVSADIRIVDAVDKGDGGGLAIIMENADAGDSGVRPIYHVVNPFTPSDWTRATGLDAGDVNGRYIVPDSIPGYFHAGFDDRDVWHTTTAPAWTEDADVLPANHAAHHCIWLREHIHGLFTAGVYMLALEDTS